jgi:hypothetical protein
MKRIMLIFFREIADTVNLIGLVSFPTQRDRSLPFNLHITAIQILIFFL